MKSLLKCITSAILVVAIAATSILVVPLTDVEAAGKMKYEKTKTVYLEDNTGKSSGYASFTIEVKKPSKKIKESSVKISNSKVVKFHCVDNLKNESIIELTAKKPGTATVTFKVGCKKYKTKVKVKKYPNPATTIKVSGVKSGKNISSKFNKSPDYRNFTLKKTTKKAKLKVKATKGWKLIGVSVLDEKTDKAVLDKDYSKGTTKLKSYNLGTLEKGHPYYVTLSFKSKKTGTYEYLFFGINNVDAL